MIIRKSNKRGRIKGRVSNIKYETKNKSFIIKGLYRESIPIYNERYMMARKNTKERGGGEHKNEEEDIKDGRERERQGKGLEKEKKGK